MRNFFSRLRARHYAWASVLVIAGIWWPSYMIASPPDFIVQGSVDLLVLNTCMAVAVLGTGIKISGFLASQQPGRLGVLGVSIELVGLILALLGPFSYIITSLSLIIQREQRMNSALIFSFAVLAMYIYRAIVIVPRFRKEAHDITKE